MTDTPTTQEAHADVEAFVAHVRSKRWSGSVDEYVLAMRRFFRVASDREAFTTLLRACDRSRELFALTSVLLAATSAIIVADEDGFDVDLPEDAVNSLAETLERVCVVAEEIANQTALAWTRDAIDDFITFQQTIGEEMPLYILLTRRIDERDKVWVRLQFEAGEPTHMKVIWASRVFENTSPTALAFALHCDVDAFQLDDHRPVVFKPAPLFRYHPERFRQSRQYAQFLRSLHPRPGLMTFSKAELIAEKVVRELNMRINEVDRRDRDDNSTAGARIIDQEIQLATSWINFVNAGKQIFELPPHLAEMLRCTDASDIPIDLLKLPYPFIYLRFGPVATWSMKPGWAIDGAYLEHYPDNDLLIVHLTSLPADPSDVNRWHGVREPVLSMAFDKGHKGLTLGAAIDVLIADQMRQLQSEEESAIDRQIDVDDIVKDIPGLAGSVRVVTEERAKFEQSELRGNRGFMHEAMHLVANAMCYLTAYPDDVSAVWPDGTPPALIERALSGTPKQKTKASSQLESMGYTKVHLCGVQLDLAVVPSIGAGVANLDRHVRTHWRRGHWRRQAHGENRSLRKLIWLMPTLVNPAHDTGDEIPGHIYRVD